MNYLSFFNSIFSLPLNNLPTAAAAQAQNAIHVIQIGNTVFDLIPVNLTNSSSSSTSRCQNHTHCRRAYRMRHSNSSLSLNSNHIQIRHSYSTREFFHQVRDNRWRLTGQLNWIASSNWKFNLIYFSTHVTNPHSTTDRSWSATVIRRSDSIAQSIS